MRGIKRWLPNRGKIKAIYAETDKRDERDTRGKMADTSRWHAH